MLEALQFVRGAVAKKDFVPALTHFCIRAGVVRGFNGTIALSSPIDLSIDAQPRALPFVKALQTCQETTVQLHMTPAGRLSIKSGSFKAFVECTTEPFPEVLPEGQSFKVSTPILPILKKLAPFIADDASRPWARGVLLRGQSAFATNNIVLIEHWLGDTPFPTEVNLPEAAVTELLRINEEPGSMQVSANSCTFHFDNNRWMRTQVLSTEWPDLTKVLNRDATPLPYPAELFTSLETLKPFLDDAGGIFLRAGSVSTTQTEELGASRDVVGLDADAKFNLAQFMLLEDVSDKIDLSTYPGPCLFYGKGLRGAIIGMRA